MEKNPIKKICDLECQCDGPGHCPVYGIYMNKSLWKKCKYNDKHRCTFSQFFMKAGLSPLTEEEKQHHILKAEAYQSRMVEAKHIKQLDDAIDKIEEQGINLENYKKKAEENREGIGDLISNVLSKVGVTEETVQKWAGIGGCGCSKRKKFLNSIMPFRK